MRLSGLVFVLILLFSSAVFAQHSSTSSAPSSPAPAPAPAAPSPAPSFSSGSASGSASSAGSVSHASAPSSPSPASVPQSHVEATPSASISDTARSQSSAESADRTMPSARSSDSDEGRVIPSEKLSGDERIVGAPRVEETPSAEKKDSKTSESDLRHRACADGQCKEPEPKPAEADLRRRRICKDGPCGECPPGKAAGKNGSCVTTTSAVEAASNCQPNESWNGAACAPIRNCQPGEVWDGANCRMDACSSIYARAAALGDEVRSARTQMQDECQGNPSGQQCDDLKLSYDGAVSRYRVLINEAPPACRALLRDPLTL
jgi:hypothetical protein